MINIESYFSGKWLECGRDWPNVDCYGLVLKVRSDMGLDSWPDWGNARRLDRTMHNAGMKFKESLTACQPEPGAIIGCYSGNFLTHVAVVVADSSGEMCALEMTERAGVTCRPIRRLNKLFTRLEFYK